MITLGCSEPPFRANGGGVQCHRAGVAGGLLFLPNDFQFKLPTKHPNYPGAILIIRAAGGGRGRPTAAGCLRRSTAGREKGMQTSKCPKGRVEKRGGKSPCGAGLYL